MSASLAHAHLADATAASEFWTKPLDDVTATREAYVHYSAAVPVNPGVIFYETMNGDRMNDNPYAIFRYLRSHPEYGSYLHVWSLSEHGVISADDSDLDDVVFAPPGTLAYAYYLASAGHLICNANLPDYLTRRDGQRYLNTWHGIPYKSLGRSVVRARFGPPGTIGTLLKATHVVTPCEFMTDALVYSYSMAGASTALLAETGYPRIDLTVNQDAEQVSRLRRTLGVEEDDGTRPSRPVVLYAPTWRSKGGKDIVDDNRLTRDLESLAALDIQLMYRGHHRIDRLVQDETIGDQVGRILLPPQGISSNELLAAVDILITDYSSIYFDFLPTGRPVVHYLYDVDHYAKTRGLNLGVDELPGAVARTVAELTEAVQRAADALRSLPAGADIADSPVQGERDRAAQLRFAPHEDGLASKRAVDFFFRDETRGVPVRVAHDGRPTVVFWAGRLTDSEESAEFLEGVIKRSKSPRYQAVMVIDRGSFIDRRTLKRIKALKGKLSCLAYDEASPALLQTERASYEDFIGATPATFSAISGKLRKDALLKGMFEREYRRRLDDARFDALVLGPGLSRQELALAAFACHRQFSLGARRAARGRLPAPLRRSAAALLPKGSARRKRAEQAYRSLRRR